MPVPRDFHRAIELVATTDGTGSGAGRVHAEVEDDYHRFRLTLTHDGHQVTAITPEAVRYPWTTCPRAADRLDDVIGLRLGHAAARAVRIDASTHCTHLLDLAMLAVTHAGRGGRRRYDVHVPRRGPGGRTRPTLRVDGEPALAWEVADGRIEGPAPFRGVDLRGGFRRWAAEHLDDETAERAGVLRRMVDLMVMVDLRPGLDDDTFHPKSLVPLPRAICHTMRDEVIVAAERPPGHVPGGIDFAGHQPLAEPAATPAPDPR